MLEDKPLLHFHLYNPGTLPKDILLKEFVGRSEILEQVFDIVSRNNIAKAQTHILLKGARNIGRTTLLYNIKYRLEKFENFGQNWITLIFAEDAYAIGDLADFWMKAIESLEVALGISEKRVDQLLKNNSLTLDRCAKKAFFDLLETSGKKVLFCIDNINQILNSFASEKELSSLYSVLRKDNRLMIIGTFESSFKNDRLIDVSFFRLFKIFELQPFSYQEMQQLLTVIAEEQDDYTVLDDLASDPGRIQAYRTLIGGKPAFIKMVYLLLHEGKFNNLIYELERFIDYCTPFFKHRISNLNAQPRRVFDAIARKWHPTAVGELTTVLRKKSNYISAQIKRLVEEGLVKEVGGGEKRKLYQVADRFFNIYYLMSFCKESKERLKWLFLFIHVFYNNEMSLSRFEETHEPDYERARYLIKERYQSIIKLAANSKLNESFRINSRDQSIIPGYQKALRRLVKSRLTKVYSIDFSLTDYFNSLSERQKLEVNFMPENSSWWQGLAIILEETGLYRFAFKAYRLAISFASENSNIWANFANLLHYRLKEYVHAEKAYRKALLYDQEQANSWFNLAHLICIRNNKNFEEAEMAYRRAIELNPLDSDSIFSVGLIQQDIIGNYAIAEKSYKKALAIDSEQYIYWSALGDLRMQNLNYYHKAEDAYKKALDLKKNNPEIWFKLGTLYDEHLVEPAKAEAAYRRCIELGEFPFAHSALAGLLFRLNGKTEEALNQAITGITMMPYNGFTKSIFEEVCLSTSSNPWLEVIPGILSKFKENPDNMELYQFSLNALRNILNSCGPETGKKLIEEYELEIPFSPIYLTIQAKENPDILIKIAPEMRQLIQEILDKLRKGKK